MKEHHDGSRHRRSHHSMFEASDRGHHPHDRGFDSTGGRPGGFNRGRLGEGAAELLAGLAAMVTEGEGIMFGNRGEGRGGREHGRDRGEFGHGHGRGRGRSERPFEQGDLRWLVLDLIATQPRHGYEIIKEIEDMLNGQYTPSPGIIYPTLTYLEETGLVSSETQGTKKLYSLTDEGRESLEQNSAAVEAVRNRIEESRVRFGAPPSPEMMRAMNNLRWALRVRLSKGEISPESLAKITAAIDHAAGEIERS